MTVNDFIQKHSLVSFASPDGLREIKGGYIGDLLSWVMGKAQADNVWITIMSNINTVAVASLSDTSLVVFAEGVVPDEALISAANAKNINLAGSALSAFQLAVAFAQDV